MKKLFTLFLLFQAGLTFAGVFTVTNLDDAGAGSLRQAITSLNASDAGPHTVNFSIPGTITLLSNLPAITKNVIFNGNAAGSAISGGGSFSIFNITGTGPALLNALFNDLELMNASKTFSITGEGGSAIHAVYMNNLGINRCYIHDCTSTVNANNAYVSAHGGAVSVQGSGGCSTSSTFLMINSTISRNRLTVTNAGGYSEAYGGGLYTQSLNDSLVNSTFFSNMVTSTSNVIGSPATATGGGMAFYGCSIIVHYCTFVRDSAMASNTAGGNSTSGAAGLSTVKYPIAIRNSIFDLNYATNSPDVGSLGGSMDDILSGGNNVVGNVPVNWPSKKATDIVNMPSGAVQLQANNYWIPSCAIPENSPALNKVVSGIKILNDERNFTRDDNPDAGSFELNGGILAVKSLQFTAAFCKPDVCLQWNTTNEENTMHFLIQRSGDGNNFKNINDVAATGSGNNVYSAIDKNPLSGPGLYRLKVIDRDGSFTYSSIIKLNIAAGKILVTPNPARGFITIQSETNINSIQLLADDGRTIKQWVPVPAGKYNITGVPAGNYFLRVETKGGVIMEKLSVVK
jgi:hypothetical protein